MPVSTILLCVVLSENLVKQFVVQLTQVTLRIGYVDRCAYSIQPILRFLHLYAILLANKCKKRGQNMISTALAILETEEERNELSQIYERNIKMFYSIAFSKLHNVQDAEDAIQEAFLSIAKNPETFFNIPADRRISYVNVIIRNTAFKIWDKKHKISENETELDDNIFDEQITTEEKALSDFSCKKIMEFIGTLPEGTKTAIYLRTSLGLKNSDIAKVLGISEEAAKKRVSRAVNQIKQYMEGLKDE